MALKRSLRFLPPGILLLVLIGGVGLSACNLAPAPSPGRQPSDDDILSVVADLLLRQPLVLVLVGLIVLALLLFAVLLRGTTEPVAGPKMPQDEEASRRPVAPSLFIMTHDNVATTHLLERDGLSIGRSEDNDIVIGAPIEGWETVSRHHARIYFDMDRWIVEDLSSRNGVYVNGLRTGRNILQDGWQLQIGGVSMIFRNGAHKETAA